MLLSSLSLQPVQSELVLVLMSRHYALPSLVRVSPEYVQGLLPFFVESNFNLPVPLHLRSLLLHCSGVSMNSAAPSCDW